MLYNRRYHVCSVFTFALAAALAGCGGGAVVGSSPIGTVATAAGAPATPSADGSSATPTASASASGRSSPVPTSSPAGSASGPQSLPPPSTPPYAPGFTSVVPPQPPTGASRTGRIYSIYITASTGDTVAFTVFEPATLTGGQTYPLILHAPGFASQRLQTLGSPNPSATASYLVGNNISEMVAANYGVISFDQRGFGQTTGKIRVDDPDFEGKDYLAILDWAQNSLPWLAFAPTLEGDDSHEPVIGTMGGSYGGIAQYLLANLDTRHRIRAITPNIAPANLNFALFPGTVEKSTFDTELFVSGNSGGGTYANFDPFVTTAITNDSIAGHEDPFAADFFGYHSPDYFSNGVAVATNGGAGTAPLLPPNTNIPKINAMIWIGVRDELFDFNGGYANYVRLKAAGGDVRLLSYQTGHNAIQEAPPDPGDTLYFPSGNDADSRCGASLNEDQAQLAWMNQYLKGMRNAASIIPMSLCVSLASGDAVVVPTIPTIASGPAETTFDIGSATVTSGTNIDVPTVVSLYTAGPQGDVMLGIPHVHLTIAPTAGVNVGTPVIFAGIGQLHASNSKTWDL